ncbi:MAG: ArsA-related P-loop ATPase [Candidatus Bipolaricaulota bacterium]|nr:AAA family ATPase [Candidatus Bipolaricaulota bacterium]MBS3791596.1 AAA family ATPase [Candidatus Bipolaricaulota bacterium]
MKVAIVGKGGVGKSTISALLGTYGVERGREVIAIDADPDMNLSSCLGVKNTATPLIELEDLIAERAGGGGLVKLNPKVSDIPDKFYQKVNGVKLMVFGTVWSGGSGCTCPENAFLREVLNHLMLERDEVVVVDMEAGIEHLGRGTGEGVDALVTVVEPDRRSLETKWRIEELAEDIGLAKAYTVCNKVRGVEDREFLLEALQEEPLGFIPYNEEIRTSSRRGEKVSPDDGQLRKSIKEIWAGLVNELS